MDFADKVDCVLAEWTREIPRGPAIFSVANGEMSRTVLVAYLVACSGQSMVDQFRLVRETLIRKNQAYGDSALNPVRVFSKLDPGAQILVRLDDKLSRLKRGTPDGEDIILDLLGYLVILTIAESENNTMKVTLVEKGTDETLTALRWGMENGKVVFPQERDDYPK